MKFRSLAPSKMSGTAAFICNISAGEAKTRRSLSQQAYPKSVGSGSVRDYLKNRWRNNWGRCQMSTSGLHMYTTNTNKFVKFLVPSLVNYFEKNTKTFKSTWKIWKNTSTNATERTWGTTVHKKRNCIGMSSSIHPIFFSEDITLENGNPTKIIRLKFKSTKITQSSRINSLKKVNYSQSKFLYIIYSYDYQFYKLVAMEGHQESSRSEVKGLGRSTLRENNNPVTFQQKLCKSSIK